MKRCLFIIVALILCLCLFVIGCQNKNDSDISSDVLTANELESNTLQKKSQVNTGTYVCEYENYIFYRNTNDNGSLYRYNTKNDSYIKLFEDNDNSFLHSIKVFDEQVYFVTRTKTDTAPTLYRISVDGGVAERLVENVCDDFAVYEDAIYYTGYQCPTHYGADYQLHKYTFADKKSDILLDLKCYKHFNAINDKIYCLVINDEGTAYGLAYFDIKTQTTVKIDTGDVNNFQSAVSANNGKIIYLNFNEFIYSYNTQTQEFKEITNDFGRTFFIAPVTDDLFYFSVLKNPNDNMVYQYKNGTISEYTETEFESIDILEAVNGKPIIFTSSSIGNAKIHGDDRLNVVVE